MEQWKTAPGFPSYEISSAGRVRRVKTGRVLRNQLGSDGYFKVSLWENKKEKQQRVTRLVAAAFVPNPHNKPHVNHIDNCPTNNAASNLEWCTAKENSQYMARQNRQGTGKRAVVRSDGKVYAAVNDTIVDGFNQAHVVNCAQGRRKVHGGFAWRYA